MYEEIELEKKAIHHSFLAFSSKLYNPQSQPSPYSNLTKADIDIKQNSIGIIYIDTRQSIDIFIRQAYCKGVYYLCGKTGHFTCKCSNQKAQIRAVLRVMTGEERQVQADKVRELNESSVEKEQPIEEAPLKEDFIDAQA